MVYPDSQIKRIKSKILDHIVFTLTTNAAGVIVDVSRGFEILSGYRAKELIGQKPKFLSHPDTPKVLIEDLWKTLLEEKTWFGEIKNNHKNGTGYWSSLRIEPLRKSDPVLKKNHTVGYLAVYTNITEQKELIRQATSDPLTGIYNRSKLNLLLSHEAEESYRYGYTFSLLFLDLDHFKNINDRYGHLEGDHVLIEMTRVIREALRLSDLFGRWGGEEFIIVLPKTKVEDAYLIAEKLRHRIQDHNFGLQQSVTLSIGIVEYSPQIGMDQMIELADQAMYQAKHQGRNQTVVFNKEGKICSPLKT